MKNFDLLIDVRIDNGRRLQTIPERFVVQFEWTRRRFLCGRSVPIIDEVASIHAIAPFRLEQTRKASVKRMVWEGMERMGKGGSFKSHQRSTSVRRSLLIDQSDVSSRPPSVRRAMWILVPGRLP